MKELKVAIQAAKEAGNIINRYFDSNLKVEKKADNSPVTIADKEAEKKIVSIIKKQFPDHNFLGEEFPYQQTDSEYKWIIDPIDGTKNFIRKVPFFATFIALEKDGKIITGVVHLPKMNILAYATKGKGCFINGKKARVSRISKLEDAFFVYGDIDEYYSKNYDKELMKMVATCARHRGFGQQWGCIFLAQGSVDIDLNLKAKPWDIAAQKIIIEEAGGKLTDIEGKDTIYSGDYLATNKKLHEEVISIFRERKS
ncbi:MAG: inositol monophosphatase [Candidatus Aenigmarchaeota archaeon]|nr:inositol monophosphatase [Candidatus Aenigmarchaeota archaeon]